MQPNIFAVGDVIGFPSSGLGFDGAGKGSRPGGRFGIPLQSKPAFYPYGIYTIPEISFIGKKRRSSLPTQDVPFEVGVAYYREIARARSDLSRRHSLGRLKDSFLTQETRNLLGVHIIGEGASELLHIGQAVMILGGTIDYFVDTVFNYPTLAECYKAAAFNGINKLSRF